MFGKQKTERFLHPSVLSFNFIIKFFGRIVKGVSLALEVFMPLTWNNDLVLNQTNIVNDVSGIYAIKDSGMNIIYIGKGDPISDRLNFHISDRENNFLLKRIINSQRCFYCYAAVPMEEDRVEWERYYIQRYNPVCNIQGNPLR